jgi:hypothetical protein
VGVEDMEWEDGGSSLTGESFDLGVAAGAMVNSSWAEGVEWQDRGNQRGIDGEEPC